MILKFEVTAMAGLRAPEGGLRLQKQANDINTVAGLQEMFFFHKIFFPRFVV